MIHVNDNVKTFDVYSKIIAGLSLINYFGILELNTYESYILNTVGHYFMSM